MGSSCLAVNNSATVQSYNNAEQGTLWPILKVVAITASLQSHDCDLILICLATREKLQELQCPKVT